MDYIQEMLLRQRAALAALLLGGLPDGRDGQDDRFDADELEISGGEQKWDVRKNRQRQAGGRTARNDGEILFAAYREGSVSHARSSQMEEAAARASQTKKSSSHRLGAQVPSGSTRRGAMANGASGGRSGQNGRMEAISAGAWETRLMAEGSRQETGAESISRMIQRDARRYDGGFTLY